jgi:hypothetical protein
MYDDFLSSVSTSVDQGRQSFVPLVPGFIAAFLHDYCPERVAAKGA